MQSNFSYQLTFEVCVSFPLQQIHAECLRVFPGELPNDSWPDIPTGEVIFADFRFQCSGMLRRVIMQLLFEDGVTYNTSLKSNLTLWQVNGSHYQRSDGATHTLDVSPASLLPEGHSIDNEDGTITVNQSTSMRINESVELPVRAGHVLGLSFPPNTTIVNHFPLAGEQDVNSLLIQLTEDDCFSPEQGKFPCPQVVRSDIRPAIRVQVDFDSDVSTQLQAAPPSELHRNLS